MALIPNLITAAPARVSHSDAAKMKSKHARKVPICIFVKKAARKGKSGAKFREVVYYHVLSGKFKGQIRPKVVAVGEKPRNGVRKMGKFRVTVTDQAAKARALLSKYSRHSPDEDVTGGAHHQALLNHHKASGGTEDTFETDADRHYSGVSKDHFSEHHKHVKEHMDREDARKQKSLGSGSGGSAVDRQIQRFSKSGPLSDMEQDQARGVLNDLDDEGILKKYYKGHSKRDVQRLKDHLKSKIDETDAHREKQRNDTKAESGARDSQAKKVLSEWNPMKDHATGNKNVDGVLKNLFAHVKGGRDSYAEALKLGGQEHAYSVVKDLLDLSWDFEPEQAEATRERYPKQYGHLSTKEMIQVGKALDAARDSLKKSVS